MQKQSIILVVVLIILMILVAGCTSTPTDEVFEDYDPNNFKRFDEYR